MKKISAKNIKGKNCLVRIDLNVSYNEENLKLKSSKETIDFLLENGAKKIILISHFGRPQGEKDNYFDNYLKEESLYIFADILKKIYKHKVWFISESIYDPTFMEVFDSISEGIVLLENVRFYNENTDLFIEKMSSLGEVFINEAFSVSHRDSGSVLGLSEVLPSFYGFNLKQEIERIDSFVKKSKNPKMLVLGGAKIDEKLKIGKHFLNQDYDFLLLGGALANIVLRYIGFETGISFVGNQAYMVLKNLDYDKVILPCDFYVLDENGNKAYRLINQIRKSDNILDIGPKSIKLFFDYLKKAKTVFWNGPLGCVDDEDFDDGTRMFIDELLKLKSNVLIGGGDTLDIVTEFKNRINRKKNMFISTGGGALLEYLEQGKLKGLKKLE